MQQYSKGSHSRLFSRDFQPGLAICIVIVHCSLKSCLSCLSPSPYYFRWAAIMLLDSCSKAQLSVLPINVPSPSHIVADSGGQIRYKDQQNSRTMTLGHHRVPTTTFHRRPICLTSKSLPLSQGPGLEPPSMGPEGGQEAVKHPQIQWLKILLHLHRAAAMVSLTKMLPGLLNTIHSYSNIKVAKFRLSNSWRFQGKPE